ncbi:MAG: adenine-specific methyltransferase EcoRI family protein, partial [Paludibacteraceae bacterium]|nr:adenine-specific methyltransferase EcoRI family protein [Paludibacteraceae bacterium]
MANKNLNAAKEAKKDEFYTQLADIENELRHYRQHFRGKTVLCNCDDPYESNFFKYFASNFNALGLKKLIATCYDGSPVQGTELLLDFGDTTKDVPKKIAHKVEITEVTDVNGDGRVDLGDVQYLLRNDKNVLSLLKGNGDFRSDECVELLKEADIVCTNPPFSLFREYVAQLMKYEKKFLIIGHMNAIKYKEIFPLIQNNKIWTGFGFNLSLVYKSPYNNILEANRKYVRQKGYDPDQCIKVPGICWYTNLDHKQRHEQLIMWKKYSNEKYPKYTNYDAIEVGRVENIPYDYAGPIGVPITFLDK